MASASEAVRRMFGGRANRSGDAAMAPSTHMAKMRCKFFQAGNCRNGEYCKFSHNLKEVELCRHHITGECKFGDECSFIHGQLCPSCRMPVLHPFDAVRNAEHQKVCTAGSGGAAQEPPPKPECGICFEEVKLFGLMTGCDHAFCLPCIRKWRQTKEQSDEATRSCPSCRTPSEFVMTYHRYVKGAERVRVIANFKERAAQTPCKHFATRRNCPFRNECLFAHLDENGNRVVLSPRRPRHVDDLEDIMIQYGIDEDDLDLLDAWIPLGNVFDDDDDMRFVNRVLFGRNFDVYYAESDDDDDYYGRYEYEGLLDLLMDSGLIVGNGHVHAHRHHNHNHNHHHHHHHHPLPPRQGQNNHGRRQRGGRGRPERRRRP